MARIRTVKPELFRHEELFEAEKRYQLPLRVAFIGLFTCCDREGRFRWKPKQLKLDVIPYDDVDMVEILNALTNSGFIIHYEVNGEHYGCIPSWNKHQYLNHREAASVLPGTEFLSVNEVTITQDLRINDGSVTPVLSIVATQTKPADMTGGNGKEQEVKLGIGMERDNEGKLALNPFINKHAEVLSVFGHWKATLQHPSALLDKKREQIIIKALESGYTVSQLCDAITGCSKTPHNMGDNEQGQRYDGLHLILRDADQIERFITNFYNPPIPANSADKLLRANLSAGQQWLNRKLKEKNADEPT